MRDVNLGRETDPDIPASVGLSEEEIYRMYRLMAIAKYDERYVIPTAHLEQAEKLEETACSLDYEDGPGMFDSSAFGEASGRPAPVSVETFHALRHRQTGDRAADPEAMAGGGRICSTGTATGGPPGLFPERRS